MNIADEIFQRADPDGIALIAEGEEVTFARLVQMTEAAQVRIAKSDARRVGLECPNGVAHVVLALAIVRAGKCLVPIATELAGPERDALIREAALGAIVNAKGEVQPVSVPAEKARFREADFAALNPAFVRFSSGTTGTSKGIVLSHEGLLARITAANRGLKITRADRVIWMLPMAHHFAVSIMLYLLNGAATVIVASHFAEEVLAAADAHRGSVIYAAPFHHALLAADKSNRPWPSLRLAVSTAAALPLRTALAFDARFGVPLSQGLGLIEVGLPLLNDAGRERPTSVGRPLPDYDVDLRDGEIFLRGPGMLDAYLHPWRTQQEILEDGWVRTGDLGRRDADGYVYLEGRSHSVINVAGLKCFPEEVEAVLATVPEVKLARVFGKPHPRVGAVPVAEIVPRDPAQPPRTSALESYCRASLARYKVPVEFRVVSTLPVTASGKVKRASV
jgi:long-chain acyl-CoA synthetase